VFRGGVNLVTVDAYPRKDGRIVEGLTPDDFEILEEGVKQAIDQFEFVRVEPIPETERRDPNNQREMLQLVADPHNRAFVIYLDSAHERGRLACDSRTAARLLRQDSRAERSVRGDDADLRPSDRLRRKTLGIQEQLTSNGPGASATASRGIRATNGKTASTCTSRCREPAGSVPQANRSRR
jgi:hypothetical protein